MSTAYFTPIVSPTPVLLAGTASITIMPDPPRGLREVEFGFSDAVATVPSPFTGQTQAQQWPGGDMWSGTATWPPLTQQQADACMAFLMALRGMSYAFLLGDPLKQVPRGTALGTPRVDNTQNNGNRAMSQSLGTKGWTASSPGVLLAGDYIQVGYRLHRVLYDVNPDSSGKAVLVIWPSLREVPNDNDAIGTSGCRGLMRRAGNKQTWSADYTRLSRLSFPFVEYR